jgi:murein L,D-transpeptidase YafK
VIGEGRPDATRPSLYLRVFKSESILEVWTPDERGMSLAATHRILAWSGTLGPKRVEGDRRAPEGFYEVGADALNPASKYHRSFDLGFPNAYDRAQGRTGSNLMIHGGAESAGCYAIGDEAITVLYDQVEAAVQVAPVPVHCFPFRMTEANLRLHRDSPWITFWRYELTPGYLWFEEFRLIPIIDGTSGTYRMA